MRESSLTENRALNLLGHQNTSTLQSLRYKFVVNTETNMESWSPRAF
jgi:hypothetical protein